MQPPRYNLCSSDQRLEPVRIQMLGRAASLMPFFPLFIPLFLPDPQTTSGPVLLPAQSWIGLFKNLFFFVFFTGSRKQLCPVSQSLMLETFHPWSSGEWLSPVEQNQVRFCDAVVSFFNPPLDWLILPEGHHASPQAATGRNWPVYPRISLDRCVPHPHVRAFHVCHFN